MKNKEKFEEELNKICIEGCDTFGLDEDGIPIACHLMSCIQCKLADSIGEKSEYMCCRECRVEWANQEYVPPKFSLPKDITMKELFDFFITHVDNPKLCSECDYMQYRYCREFLFIDWLIENDIIELKADIKMINKDWRGE